MLKTIRFSPRCEFRYPSALFMLQSYFLHQTIKLTQCLKWNRFFYPKTPAKSTFLLSNSSNPETNFTLASNLPPFCERLIQKHFEPFSYKVLLCMYSVSILPLEKVIKNIFCRCKIALGFWFTGFLQCYKNIFVGKKKLIYFQNSSQK